MVREKILLSDLDIEILDYLKQEHNINQILDEFGLYHSQFKLHFKRIKNYLHERKYGTFKFLKTNEKGLKIIELVK